MAALTIVQNHIHIGLIGGSMSGYNEPGYRYDHVEKRTPHYEMSTSFVRSRTGNPAFHVLKDPTTLKPLVFQDKEYSIRVSDDELQILLGLSGSVVYLIDNRHCDDGIDHSPYLQVMAMFPVNYNGNLDPMLKYNEITLSFKDMNTRSPI